MAQESHRQFMKRVRRAAADPQLTEALRRASASYEKQREDALQGLDFAALRQQVREVKERSLAQLPELYERFRQEAEQLGAQVVLAPTVAEARGYLVALAQRLGTRLVVKSKSMATEEIGLNHALAERGVRVLETDLGEYIVQLAGERPSHFVTPAIHKTREQIAEIFSRQAGRRLPPDIPTLVEFARQELRPAFSEAGLGVTGANLAIAESGTLVIATNEGNARLVSSLPPVHAAVVGLEKLVPALEDTVPILKLLGRCATGQKLTAYTSFITGPSRTADIEKQLIIGVHGPRELHIIFLDGGREAMRQDPELREALYCIRCSACLNLCPAFKVVSGHVFGRTYHGGIGSVLTAGLEGAAAAKELLELCTGCRYCLDICPAKVDTPRLVRVVKERQAQQAGVPLPTRAASWVLAHPSRLGAAAGAARLGQRLLGPAWGVFAALPLPGGAALRAAPPLAAEPLASLWAQGQQASSRPTEREAEPVQLYPGCLVSHVYPEVGLAARRLLLEAGLRPELLPAGCCGMPALHLLDLPAARRMAEQTVRLLAGTAGSIITVCPTCSVALRQEYPRLLAGSELEQEAARVAERTRELCELLAARGFPPLPVGEGRTVAHHQSCHLKRSLGIAQAPAELLAAAGYRLVELAEADRCCGFAGTYAVRLEPVAMRILARKMECLAAAAPQVVATDCPGCLLHLRRGAAQHGFGAPIAHTALLLSPP